LNIILRREIEQVVGEYMFDVPDFRTNVKERLLSDIYKMTEKRFNLAKHLLKTKKWDFFMMVEIGVDRIHHGFWVFYGATHPKFVPGLVLVIRFEEKSERSLESIKKNFKRIVEIKEVYDERKIAKFSNRWRSKEWNYNTILLPETASPNFYVPC